MKPIHLEIEEAGTCISLYYAYELNKIEALQESCSLHVYGSNKSID